MRRVGVRSADEIYDRRLLCLRAGMVRAERWPPRDRRAVLLRAIGSTPSPHFFAIDSLWCGTFGGVNVPHLVRSRIFRRES